MGVGAGVGVDVGLAVGIFVGVVSGASLVVSVLQAIDIGMVSPKTSNTIIGNILLIIILYQPVLSGT